MPFVTINKSRSGASIPSRSNPEVRMGSHLQTDKVARGIYISIASVIIEELGWEVTERGLRRVVSVLVHEGVGSDAGFWLLSNGELNEARAYVLGGERGKAHTFASGISVSRLAHYVLNDTSVPVAPVEFTVDAEAKTILVECPDWLRYNPQSYTPPEEERRSLPRATADARKEQARPPARSADPEDDVIHLNRGDRRRLASEITRRLKR